MCLNEKMLTLKNEKNKENYNWVREISQWVREFAVWLSKHEDPR